MKRGRIALNGMYANELTGLCRPEELLQLCAYSTRLGAQCGVKVDSAIHAGQSKSDTTPEALAYIKRKYRVPNLPDTFETGGIVGIAEITGCVKHHRSKWFQGKFGWLLANARRLPFKPCKGQLKFFTPKI